MAAPPCYIFGHAEQATARGRHRERGHRAAAGRLATVPQGGSRGCQERPEAPNEGYSDERRIAAKTAKNSARVSFGLDVRPVANPPIGQAAADNALHRFAHALAIIDAVGFAVVVPIVELGQIPVKMFF